ncbi:MAG: hypothetical protein JXR51_06755 [Bacteroidales bacterium]|nr:hypothetical protein [Bacteroidales bacterium]MBN2756863.1 hypothetical protein [Bacteroidales bacterium]
MKQIILTISILISSILIFAQAPGWIKYETRTIKYPENNYLMSFSSETNYYDIDANELINRCVENTKKGVSESVNVSIKSVTVSGISNVNTGIDAETVEYIKHSSVSYSNIELSGLKTETYYDKRKKIAYAITYITKINVINLYKQKLETLVLKIEENIKQANNFKKSNLEQKAYLKFSETLALFRDVEEAQTILVALGTIDKIPIQREKVISLKSEIDKEINTINSSVKNSVSDLAFFISQELKMQIPKLDGNISLSIFNYQDTKISSPFAKNLYNNLEQKLISNSNYNIINIDEFKGNVVNKKIDYIITGNYWEEDNFLKIVVTLRDFKTGKALASVESKILKDYCINNSITYLPENFINANAKIKNFSENEIVGGDLNLEVWTNKGNNNLLFQENDTLSLYLRVNKECFVRFIYHLADGSSVLLLDDYYIGTDKVNKVYKLPEVFVCTEPFGAELLQVNAQTEKFPAIETENKYGYDFIIENFASVLEKSRGFKKIDDEMMKAENTLIITTMRK